MSVVRFRPRPPRFTLQRSQPMRLASLFPGANSPRVRSISGLLLFCENFPHFSPCQWFRSRSCARQSMFGTDTTGTPTRNKQARRASVPAVPEKSIGRPIFHHLIHCRWPWGNQSWMAAAAMGRWHSIKCSIGDKREGKTRHLLDSCPRPGIKRHTVSRHPPALRRNVWCVPKPSWISTPMTAAMPD